MFCGMVIKPNKKEVGICKHCLSKLTFLDNVPTCRICGCQLDGDEPFCVTCQTHQHYFTRAISCLPYRDNVRHSVLQYKFGGRRDYSRTFSRILYYRVLPFHKRLPFDCVVCVPMTQKSLAERGYHQTQLLATFIAKELGIPFLPEAFRKTKETAKQSTLLGYSARFKNVEKAFALSMPAKSFKGKNILLIDDVLTTGATADALSKLLVSAGSSRIIVATIAGTQKEQVSPVTKEDELMVTY